MSSWWDDTPESRRELAEEIALVKAAELVTAGLEEQGVLRKELARRLEIKASELSQRLSGRRNLTVRSLAAMAHALGYKLELGLSPVHAGSGTRPTITSHRELDWPQPAMRYTQTGVAVRGLKGVDAA